MLLIQILLYREYTPTEFVLWVRIVSFQFGQKATLVDIKSYIVNTIRHCVFEGYMKLKLVNISINYEAQHQSLTICEKVK